MQDRIRLPDGAIVNGDGSVFFRETADYYEAKAIELSPSQVEISAKRPSVYFEGTEDDLTDRQRAYLNAARAGRLPEPTEEEIAERAALKVRISANRAKGNVRKLCKVITADALLTLTYRVNQLDLALCKQHLREFVRRFRRVCPEFRAVAAFERQARGAWHVHLACPSQSVTLQGNIKSYNLIRAIWRSVTGELGGNIDVSKRFRKTQSSCARIAGYLSKYITKAFAEGEKWSNRWTRFGEMSIPAPVNLGIVTDLRQFIVDAYALCGRCTEVASAVISPWGDWFYLSAEGLS